LGVGMSITVDPHGADLVAGPEHIVWGTGGKKNGK